MDALRTDEIKTAEKVKLYIRIGLVVVLVTAVIVFTSIWVAWNWL